MMLNEIGLSRVDNTTVLVTNCGSASNSVAINVLTTAAGIAAWQGNLYKMSDSLTGEVI